MVVRRRKKYHKYVGKRYARRGYNDRNRGAGNRGGRGKAGWRFGKHKYHKILREHPEILKNKKGFSPIRQREEIVINVGDLKNLIHYLDTVGMLKEEEGKIVLNLEELGYTKLLGTGAIDVPLKVIIPKASETAINKINSAGGEVILTSVLLE